MQQRKGLVQNATDQVSSNKVRYRCPFERCDEFSESFDDLQHHIRRLHWNNAVLKTPTNRATLACRLCPLKFNDFGSLQAHIENHIRVEQQVLKSYPNLTIPTPPPSQPSSSAESSPVSCPSSEEMVHKLKRHLDTPISDEGLKRRRKQPVPLPCRRYAASTATPQTTTRTTPTTTTTHHSQAVRKILPKEHAIRATHTSVRPHSHQQLITSNKAALRLDVNQVSTRHSVPSDMDNVMLQHLQNAAYQNMYSHQYPFYPSYYPYLFGAPPSPTNVAESPAFIHGVPPVQSPTAADFMSLEIMRQLQQVQPLPFATVDHFGIPLPYLRHPQVQDTAEVLDLSTKKRAFSTSTSAHHQSSPVYRSSM